MENQVGFLCNNNIVLSIDGETVSLKFNGNKITDVEVLNKHNEFANECKEVKAEIVELYTAKYYPRIYYTVFRVVLELQPKTKKLYLMERFDGSRGSVMFYKCRNFKSCLSKIDKLELEED